MQGGQVRTLTGRKAEDELILDQCGAGDAVLDVNEIEYLKEAYAEVRAGGSHSDFTTVVLKL